MRAILAVSIGLFVAPAVFPQEREPASRPPATNETEQGDPWIGWKWANFLILAGILGYMISKVAGNLYRTQSEGITRGIAEATKIRQDAEARAAEIEQRLAGIQGDIEALRSQARAEMTAESERISRDTEHQLKRLQQQSEQEIELMTRVARQQLKAYSAELALELAEQQIRGKMNPETQNSLVRAFAQDLHNETGRRPAQ
jgi:F-type H+-transporting ATPase subunit b